MATITIGKLCARQTAQPFRLAEYPTPSHGDRGRPSISRAGRPFRPGVGLRRLDQSDVVGSARFILAAHLIGPFGSTAPRALAHRPHSTVRSRCSDGILLQDPVSGTREAPSTSVPPILAGGASGSNQERGCEFQPTTFAATISSRSTSAWGAIVSTLSLMSWRCALNRSSAIPGGA